MAVGNTVGSLDIFVQKLNKESCQFTVLKTIESLQAYITSSSFDLKTVNKSSFQDLLRVVADAGVVKDLLVDQNKDYEPSDFKYLPETAELSFLCLSLLCDKDIPLPRPETLVSLLLLCGAHHQLFLWSSELTVLGSKDLSRRLCLLLKKEDLHDILIWETSQRSTVVNDIFTELKRSLNKNNWRRNPCTHQIFKWILLHLKHFELPELLPDVLPPALLFLDDHVSANKLLGLQCMHHIIQNVPPTVLSWQGRAEVVYDALQHLLYTREPEVICALHPCLLDLLAGMEPNPNSAQRPLKPCRYDDLFTHLLSSMAMEQKIKLRNAYAMQLPRYIEKMGITILSHSKRLFDVIDEYLSVYDGPSECSRLQVLMAVHLIIQVAWPRMTNKCGRLLKCLLRLLCDLKLNPHEITEAVKNEVIMKTKLNLLLLNKACPETFQILTSEVVKAQGVADPVVEILKEVLDVDVKER